MTEVSLGQIIRYQKGRPPNKNNPSSSDLIPILTPDYLRSGVATDYTPRGCAHRVLDGSELVLLWDGSNAGEFFRARHGMLASTMVAFEFDPNEFDSGYLYYELKRLEPRLKASTSGSGIPHVDKEILLQHRVRKPTRNQQAKVAKILTTFDRMIYETEALIAKYRRVKTGLMEDLLTHGIDKHGNLRDPTKHKFKDSILGKISADWELITLDQISHRITSGSRGWAEYYAESGALFIRVGNLTREHVNLRWDDIQFVRPPETNEGKRTSLEAGDLLISITADLGIIGVVPEGLGEAYINQHIALAKLRRKAANPWYVGRFLTKTATQRWIAQLNESGAKAGLNLPTVRSLPIVLPKLAEQNVIAELLRKAELQIEVYQMQQYKLVRLKVGLMRDLLTGELPIEPILNDLQDRLPKEDFHYDPI